ncbi:hypothetical protein D3C72_1248840 [compost metagenome]
MAAGPAWKPGMRGPKICASAEGPAGRNFSGLLASALMSVTETRTSCLAAALEPRRSMQPCTEAPSICPTMCISSGVRLSGYLQSVRPAPALKLLSRSSAECECTGLWGRAPLLFASAPATAGSGTGALPAGVGNVGGVTAASATGITTGCGACSSGAARGSASGRGWKLGVECSTLGWPTSCAPLPSCAGSTDAMLCKPRSMGAESILKRDSRESPRGGVGSAAGAYAWLGSGDAAISSAGADCGVVLPWDGS